MSLLGARAPDANPRRDRLRWGRMGRLLLGYLAASLALVSVLPLVGLVFDMIVPIGGPDEGMRYFYLIAMAAFGLAYWMALVFGALPGLAWILLSEALRLRTRTAHIAGGMVCAVAAWSLLGVWAGKSDDFLVPSRFAFRFFTDLAVAGAVAGLAYWAVAGRTAGRWRRHST